VELLKLGGMTGLEDLEGDVNGLGPRDEADWQRMAARLREAGSVRAAGHLRRCLDERQYEAAVRLIRVLPPFDRRALLPLAETDGRPAVELRQEEARSLGRWLADRCRAEAAAPGASPAARDYYSRAAEDYLHSTR